MLESEVGLRVALIRQNEGKEGSASLLPGGVKLPASTVFATVIDTVGEDNFAMASHDCACSAAGVSAIKTAPAKSDIRSIMARNISMFDGTQQAQLRDRVQ